MMPRSDLKSMPSYTHASTATDRNNQVSLTTAWSKRLEQQQAVYNWVSGGLGTFIWFFIPGGQVISNFFEHEIDNIQTFNS